MKNTKSAAVITFLLTSFGSGRGVAAQEGHGGGGEQAPHANHLAVFTGATSQPRDEGTHPTLGVDYVRRLGSAGRWGVGVAAEVILAGHSEWIFAGTGTWFPWRGLSIRGGIGLELYQESSGGGDGGETTNATSTLVRAGAGYAFDVAGFTVAPVAMFDFVRNTDTIVWGVEFGRGF